MRRRIDRRSFVKSSGVGLIGVSLFPLNSKAAQDGSNPGRRVYPLNRKWLFSEKNVVGGTSLRFDDTRFTRVTIPHTNKMLPWHGFDDKDYQFVSLYRRHFQLPAGSTGKRVFIDFGAVMTAATVHINGHRLGEYRGGYTPFSYELTQFVNWRGDNVIAVEVDSTERKDIPPFGGDIDYLTFGGIYRDVELRIVPQTFIENVFAKPVDVLGSRRRLEVRCFLETGSGSSVVRKVRVELLDGASVVEVKDADVPQGSSNVEVTLTNLGFVQLWDLNNPKLYDVRVTLLENDRRVDEYKTRTGFREARFTPDGFFLNDKHLKLRGLNRHQTYPFVGQAMPARVQKRDAWILKKELKCNIVRTSHYPQSPHFLDACDEYGLLVLEEIPGWQHIGDQQWKDLSVHYVESMVRRDWNHPAIVLWGVRVNESRDDHDFYTRTNQLARSLDNSRQTAGIRYNYESELLEDVFTMNDFQIPLRPPKHPLYLNTEFIGHMYPTKRNDNVERVTEHAMRHARVHNQLASDKRYAGGIGWCAFDYNTHANFCSTDRICYHGVADIFRLAKPAGGFYRSQCDPTEEIVLEPAFDWSRGDRNESFNIAMVSSNCDHLKIYIGKNLVADINPDRENFPHLKYPPFVTNLRQGINKGWGDMTLEGYLGGRLVITKKLSGQGADRQFHMAADDRELNGDGIDATRVVLKVTDEYGAVRPLANAAISLSLTGPGQIIGENPFSLFGGAGAVWVKAREIPGVIKLTGKHPYLGEKTVEITVKSQRPEIL
ncbi:MAG TPA: glycoside hydrolase family 2 TIM barrel-domain containing protein [Pyrinomonadaceae bacterium]|jgi:beta-galactosidase|nr:glycoside hydrolase family 2 TIM barrel-domain containing protein [Pyrinomonadaceae bacterium]